MLDGRNFEVQDSQIDSWCTYSSNSIDNQNFKYCLTAWRRQQKPGCISAEHDHFLGWSLHLPITTSHLDCRGSSSHVDKVLPLQDGPEAALERDDSPQHFLVEEGLKTLTLRLPQEHLNNTGTFTYTHTTAAVQQITITEGNRGKQMWIPTMVLPTWYPAGGRWIRRKNSLMPDLVGLVPRGSSTWKWRTKSWKKMCVCVINTFVYLQWGFITADK